jgi:predicted Fe-Mo cluster-binding NifX family protein
MRKAAFAIWNNRIAPVFDVARHLHLVEAESGRIVRETQDLLADDLPAPKVLHLAERNIDVLVCGAISRPLQEMVTAYGIRVIPFIAGELHEVVQVWLSGGSDWRSFTMPGCQGRGRRRGPGMTAYFQGGNVMAGKNRGGMGGGMKGAGGRMQGQTGRGSGRRGTTAGAGQALQCVCPQCGETQPHQRGVPCFEHTCSKCGAQMIRK